MSDYDDLANRLENAKKRRRRARQRAEQDRRLDLRAIAPHLPELRLYDRPVEVPKPMQPALCPTCGDELVVFAHKGCAMLMCEPCLRMWPTSARAETPSVLEVVRQITPFEEIRIKRKGNEQDYSRVYYARNREKLLAYQREWRSNLPEEGKRYHRAYYQANRERIIARTLANYHAKKEERQAKNAEYRKKNREKERERKRRWREQNPEKFRAQQRAYEAKTRERRNALARARREAKKEQAS